MAKNKEKAGAGRTIVILLVVLLLLLTAGAYGYGVYYFSSHFLPGSMVNGFNCSYMASEDTDAALVCCLPAVAAAAHPVVVISQCNNTHAKFLCQLYCTVHSQFCI